VVKSTKNPEQPTTPSEFAQVPPRDLYPTSDIRFVLVEIGKLSASVDRLIDDVSAQGTKVDAIRHQVSFIKGAMWASGILIAAVLTIGGFVLSSKWDAVVAALNAFHK
jgi:hypothetical protein